MPCVFCGIDRRLSREHVFASWMEDYFPDLRSATADYIRRTVTQAEDVDHTRPGPVFDFVTRDVCEVCNNGWMSGLEDQVRPILGPMLRDQPRVLTAPEQMTLATWATKTMLAMGGVNLGDERVVNDAQYRWFAEHRIPLPSSHVWLCRYTDRTRWPVSAHQWGMTVGPADDTTLRAGDPMNGFGVVFAVGPVAFWLFGYDLPGAPQTQGGSDDTHVLIWPALGSDVYWPPPKALESERDLMELARRVPTGTVIRGDSINP
jgi:hypothetical protein